MKLYTVQYAAKDQQPGEKRKTIWCASISDATKAYNEAEEYQPAINIVTLPSGREEMAKWLNERGIRA
jgi:hypothetical protein